MDFPRRFRWTCGWNACCAATTGRVTGGICAVCNRAQSNTSARSRATRNNTCFITSGRRTAVLRRVMSQTVVLTRIGFPPTHCMSCQVEILFTPAEFRELPAAKLTGTTCVVFDVLRATSTFITALANGAHAIIPVATIAEALAAKQIFPDALLAGERNGLRIGASQSGGVEFDLGNSPREFLPARVAGRTIISTTTNGTRALRACAAAGRVLAGSWLNLAATCDYVIQRNIQRLLLVCAGTGEDLALEDAFAAGNFCDLLATHPRFEFSDSARVGLKLFHAASADLTTEVKSAANARRLLANAALRDDLEFCLGVNRFPIIAGMDASGKITRLSE
ncbi:MAG: 2-phosphosulfolactate phosphatase [Verrucomicrobia bacterium]|nr:MAG: 2-phosphosulfolactate phosphatase [Verrucomicrobiota bacterium]